MCFVCLLIHWCDSRGSRLEDRTFSWERGLSVVAPTFGPIMWESLTNEDSAELLEEKLKGIQESRLGGLGEHIGTVSQWHQVPMSHIGSFVVLNGLMGFGFSVSGMRWAAAVMQRMGEEPPGPRRSSSYCFFRRRTTPTKRR